MSSLMLWGKTYYILGTFETGKCHKVDKREKYLLILPP